MNAHDMTDPIRLIEQIIAKYRKRVDTIDNKFHGMCAEIQAALAASSQPFPQPAIAEQLDEAATWVTKFLNDGDRSGLPSAEARIKRIAELLRQPSPQPAEAEKEELKRLLFKLTMRAGGAAGRLSNHNKRFADELSEVAQQLAEFVAKGKLEAALAPGVSPHEEIEH